MSLTTALQRYPVLKNLSDGRPVQLRPLKQGDCEAITEFYPSIPEHERMFIKHPVTDMSIFEDWCCLIDYQRNLPLLAFHEGQIIGDGTLHQRNGGWKKHIGMVTVLTHPDYRGLGLSEILVAQLIDLARQAGLKKLEAEFTGERTVAIQSFTAAGFRTLAALPDYLQDMQAKYHDYVLLGMDLLPSGSAA